MRPEELMDVIKKLLDDHNHELGFEYISFGDGTLLPAYPAALVVYEGTQRAIHGTHYFLTVLTVDVYVIHASLELSRQERVKEDLELTTKVTRLIHSKGIGGGASQLDPRIHKMFVESEEPALISTENITAIGTALTIAAEVREAFR